MPAALTRFLRLAAVALATAGAAGCTGLAALQGVTEPNDLYELTPAPASDPALPEVAAQIVVEEPTAASAVNTDRITVKPNKYQVVYFPKARWVDRAPLMVQAMLVESIESTGKVGAVGRQAIGLRADFTLLTELREFEVVVEQGGAAPFTVSVRLNIKIVQEPDGLIVGSQNFARQVPAAGSDLLAVVAAFDAALGQAVGEAVDWSVRRIAGIVAWRGDAPG